ncbi:dihydrolipoyl dehydrogenase family protein [Methanolobus halotolerans]|uniref:NAD(P)/FAD-dependent oxidoreductase n=1 Tax=Methanolobus halotolerans TaxID=2052935 RepID=A0A4E0Q983_9EURY|nr:NAD(P)/FAD-dependent oxidoreductase [Methanolobus halotolerans]TGC11460.1 NAD(P)/FAD-dependent oxidoreductase [Methanolobus halotolerans]
MEKYYDAIVVGTGVAGSAIAHRLKSAGMKVAVTDIERYGGTCVLKGCTPKKILTGMADIIDSNNRMAGKGGAKPHQQINWKELIEFKNDIIDRYSAARVKGYEEAGIDTYHGRAHFADGSTLMIEDDRLRAKYIVLATGAKPADIRIPGMEHITTSSDFLDLEELPERIIFGGGGFISFELAHAAARAGIKATILHRSQRVLKNFEPDLALILIKASEYAGIHVRTMQEIRKIEYDTKTLEITVTALDRNTDEELTYTCDMVVHGLGRTARIEGLKPEEGNVATKDGYIDVNEYLQSTSNPRVYAAGDCIKPGLPLTPVATMQGKVVASNILEGNRHKPDHSTVASAVFTIPPLAGVGLSEKEMTDNHEVIFNDMCQWYSVIRTNMEFAASKVIVEKGSGRIVGAHMLGPDAENVVNLFSLAIRHGMRISDVKDVLYAYPSITYDINSMLG